MSTWQHDGGFSLDASVRIEGQDREGLERLLRYCARPPFALERIERIDEARILYRLPKPTRDGKTRRTLTPLECISRLAAPFVNRTPSATATSQAEAASPLLRRAGAQCEAAPGRDRADLRGRTNLQRQPPVPR